MERRELIKLVSLATGSLLSAPLMGSLIVGCKGDISVDDQNYQLLFFEQKDFSLVQKLVDIILPKTDSPSASEVNVHKTIDLMIGTVYKPEQRRQYLVHFFKLKEYLESSKKEDLITLNTLSKSDDDRDKLAKKALMDLKQQTIAYYLSTEVIAKNHLNYLPIPGKYEACISLDEVNGKAWAL